MRGRVALVVVLVVAGVIVAAFNWEAMTQGVTIDLLFVTVTTTVGAIAGLVAATLIIVFLLAALLDRSRHLQQLSLLERHLDAAREELARKRAADLEALGAEIEERFESLRSGVEGSVARVEDSVARVEDSLAGRLDETRSDLAMRIDGIRERIVTVRDELAADIAEVEDALLRGRREVVVPELEEEP